MVYVGCSGFGHFIFPCALLPRSGAAPEAVLRSHVQSHEKEEDHMPQPGERDDDQHDLSCQEMEEDQGPVIKPLMVSQKPGKEGGHRNQEHQSLLQELN